MALLCVTVTGDTMAGLRARRDEAARVADLVELRLDGVADPDPAGAVAGRTCPVIVACHPAWEGGRFDGSEDERRALLRAALAAGAEYVDVEWRAGFDDLVGGSDRARAVVSHHVFDGVPTDLADRYRAMRQTGGAIVKVAVQSGRFVDLAPLFALGRAARDEGVVLIGMGTRGLVTRVLAEQLGSRWTYAGMETRVGQVSAERMLDELAFRRVAERSAAYAVVGSPVVHSLSPAMHNAGFADAGIDAVYVPIEPADADDFWEAADLLNLKGASVTAPFKLTLMPRAELDPIARRIGAVNTLKRCGERWEATNTDAAGFLAPLAQQLSVRQTRVTILGAGGAARAAAVALNEAGAVVSVSGRRHDRAAAVAALAGGTVTAFPPPRGTWDVLVNATPNGMSVEDEPLVRAEDMRGGQLVYDLVYAPARTRLLCEAEGAGCRTLGGLAMLVAQAERQFEWWTGRHPRAGLFAAAAEQALRRRGVGGGAGHPGANQ